MIKLRIKSTLKFIIKLIILNLNKNKYGAFILSAFNEALIAMKCNINYNNLNLHFHIPNAITRYRAHSFATKEPETLVWLDTIPDGSVFWDVGANIGIYSIYIAKKRNIKVIAFEPSVFNLEFLARNIFLNQLQSKITIFPIALSDTLGPSLFRMSSTAWGGALSTFGQDFNQHGGKLNSIFEYQIIGTTMDEAIQFFNVPAPNFIKIDVDGIEHFILRGGSEMLKKVDSVMIEIDDNFTIQSEESEKYLRNAGLILLRKCGTEAGSQHNQWWVREKMSYKMS